MLFRGQDKVEKKDKTYSTCTALQSYLIAAALTAAISAVQWTAHRGLLRLASKGMSVFRCVYTRRRRNLRCSS